MADKTYNKQRTQYAMWLLLPFVFLLSSITAFAQEQQPLLATNQNEDDTEIACFDLTTNLVLLDVHVEAIKGLPVLDLTHEYFAIYEDKVKQKIVFFMVEDSSIGTYKIGYYPTNSNRDGTFRKIRVRVTYSKEQGWKVRYAPKNYIMPID